MKLLIVESPGKIGKLKDILGSGWDVQASYGHIRDLPVKEYGISPKNGFKPHYVATEYGVKTIAKLKEAVAKADEVYLATDPDREGEAIAWHLADELKLTNYKRVTYTSITPKEVIAGISNARNIDMALVHAQEARRVLDRLCGYTTSMPLSNAIGTTVSAGRVQSPAVRLVVERERAIRSFKTTLHYGVEATFEYVENVQDGWKAKWNTENFLTAGQEYILDKTVAEKITGIRTFDVIDFIESNKNSAPPAPFTTSTLQQAASNALKFTPKETMSIAQTLYEAGLITYMRTDSPNLSDEAYEEIKSFALNENLPVADQKRTWKSKENSQEAHEAIRPTDITVYDIEAKEPERQLYKLIRDRTLACVLKDAVYSVRQTKLKALIEEKEVFFEAKGSTLIEQELKITDQTCLKCGSPLKHCKGVSKTTGKAYDFFACENEECKATFNNENGKPVEQKTFDTGRPTEFNCPECGKTLMARTGKQGKIYFACSGYPDCKKTFPSRPNGTPNFEPSTPKTTIKAKRK